MDGRLLLRKSALQGATFAGAKGDHGRITASFCLIFRKELIEKRLEFILAWPNRATAFD